MKLFRSTTVIVLLSCLATPALAQVAKPPDPAGQVHASEPGSAGSKGQTPAGQSVAATPAAAYPLDSFRDFSALMIGSRAEPGEGTSQSHVYRSGNQMRMEEPGGRAYFLTDLGTGETYGIVETGCVHDDRPYFRAIPFYISGMADATVTRNPAGIETVGGHSCQVEDVTVSSPMFPYPQKMRFWEAEDLEGFPIKIEFVLPRGHGPVIRYKNVVLGAQDSTLFFHPKSCQPLPEAPAAPSAPRKE
jgi:hypothetical protein